MLERGLTLRPPFLPAATTRLKTAVYPGASGSTPSMGTTLCNPVRWRVGRLHERRACRA